MKSRFIIILFTVITVAFAIVFYLTKLQNSGGNSIQQAKGGDIKEIRLTAEAPFSVATIIIDNQGNVDYNARPYKPNYQFTSDETGRIVGVKYDESGPVKNEIKDSSKITKIQYNDLVNLINTNNFFSFQNKYIEKDLEDATTYIITVKKDNIEKSVSCYGECPQKLIDIRNKIKELWNKEIVEIGI